jgi:hypothetical protein
MDEVAVERALAAYLADVRHIFLSALKQVRCATGSKSAQEANSKFDGFEGRFATLEDFHAGAEASLQLGYPNPDIMKGIRLEHTAHPSVLRLFVTPNYRLATCLAIEYAWAVDPNILPKQALDFLVRLMAERDADVEVKGGDATMLGWPLPAGRHGLSLLRGKDVDIDSDALTVTFRCCPLRSAAPRSCLAVERKH